MFRFSLQRVLELKARREEAAATELARTRAGAEQARLAREGLEAAREEGVRQVTGARQGAMPTVGELRNSGFLLQQLQGRIELARQAESAAEAKVEESMAAFTVASQERRVLDRLREKHLEGWQAEQSHADRQTMDAIALTRFTQKSTATDPENEEDQAQAAKHP